MKGTYGVATKQEIVRKVLTVWLQNRRWCERYLRCGYKTGDGVKGTYGVATKQEIA